LMGAPGFAGVIFALPGPGLEGGFASGQVLFSYPTLVPFMRIAGYPCLGMARCSGPMAYGWAPGPIGPGS
jgi:hypothetical protein